MARDRPADRRPWLDDPPSEVEVTVVAGGGRAPFSRGPLLALAAVVAGLGVVVSLAARGAGPGRAPAPAALFGGPPISGHEPVTQAVYRYPLGCLGATLRGTVVPTSRPDRSSPCWRYGVFVTAILRRVHGVWRLALEASAPSCTVRSLPAAVRVQVLV